MTEPATTPQINAIMKAKLHPAPWTLTKQEAWKLMNEKFPNKEASEEAPFPVEKVGYKPAPSSKEFHLSPEQVNTNALNIAISFAELVKQDMTIEEVISLGHQFKQFIEE